MCFFCYVSVGFVGETIVVALMLAIHLLNALLAIPNNDIIWGDIASIAPVRSQGKQLEAHVNVVSVLMCSISS